MADALRNAAGTETTALPQVSIDAVPRWRKLLNRIHVRSQIGWLTLRYRLVLRAVSLGTVFSVVGLVPLAYESLRGNGFKLAVDLPLVIVIIAVATVVAWILTSLLSYRRSAQRYRNIVIPAEERVRRRSELSLSRPLVEAGYAVGEFRRDDGPNEFYVMSDAVNRHLGSGASIELSLTPEQYELPESVRPFVPGLLRRLLYAKTIVHNGKLAGLRSEITPTSTSATLQRSRYLEAQSSDEIIDRLLWDIHDVEPSTDGRRLVIDEEGALKPLHLTAATNYIGVSTLVVTSDNFVYFQRQGTGSNVNAGRWAPSGSGSVDFRDWKVVRREARRRGQQPNLTMLLAFAAEREFVEEFGLDGFALPKCDTTIIGFVRLIERGGKPDFFAVTRMPMSRSDLELLMARRKQVTFRERGLSTKAKHAILIEKNLRQTVLNFLNEEPEQSIQNYLFGEILGRK
ncbi:hypothetical protein DC31_09645 [Microbacterium sp. CH12i]|uniref:hypothetical protein n=1 Tax=Microbacterium sp. CH12i TaxID=1479651 RepID=UPI000461DFC9|nr:hypothetical protein [Microbacterium sp. CH12i]KDA06692.1 hypothetical protein DC31_09645 [Microbacterium sp. CH12i]